MKYLSTYDDDIFLFCRYDYENCNADASTKMMRDLQQKITQPSFVGETFVEEGRKFVVEKADNYEYVDPIDRSVSKNQVRGIGYLGVRNKTFRSVTTRFYVDIVLQGLRIIFTNSSRLIFRLSGTGSSGATIRLYVESYEPSDGQIDLDAQIALKPLIKVTTE